MSEWVDRLSQAVIDQAGELSPWSPDRCPARCDGERCSLRADHDPKDGHTALTGPFSITTWDDEDSDFRHPQGQEEEHG